MFCPNCGREVPDGASFCPKCGVLLFADNGGALKPGRKGVVIGAAVAIAVIVAAVAIAVYIMFFRPYDIDERTFPDAPLRTAIAMIGDTDSDGKLSREEAASIESLDVSNSSTTSFEGMQLLPNLTSLNASDCANLVDADCSKVPNLMELDLSNSPVERVDASCMKGLQKLSASGTRLSSLDVSANKGLAELDVDGSVEVLGLDATNLKEQWLLTSYTTTGYRGVTEKTGLGGPGVTGEKGEFQYDESNKLVHASFHTDTSADMASDRYLTFTRDQSGLLLGFEERYGGNSSATSYEYAYDAEGRVCSSTSSSSVSSADRLVVYYEYNADGNLALRDMDKSRGRQTSSTVYEYNSAQQLVEMRQTEGGLQTLITYGELGRVNHFENNRGVYEFEYDSEGRCIGKRVHDGFAQMAQGTVSYIYDEQGRLASATRSCVSDAYSFDMAVTCQFDEHGNEVHRDLVMNSANGNTNSGTVDFAFTRVFVDKETPDAKSPIVKGDPTCWIEAQGPVEMDLFAGESAIVKASLCQADAIDSAFCI